MLKDLRHHLRNRKMSLTSRWRISPSGGEDRGRGVRHEVVTNVSTLGVSIICRFDHILKYVCLFVCLHSESVEECLYYLLIWPHTRFCLFICLFVYPHSSIEMFLCIYINSVFSPHAWGDIFFSSETRFLQKTTSLASSLNLRHPCLCTGEIFQCSWCDHENTRADTFTSTLWHVITSWPPEPHVFTLFLPLKFHATHHNHEQRIPTKQLNRKKLETRYSS